MDSEPLEFIYRARWQMDDHVARATNWMTTTDPEFIDELIAADEKLGRVHSVEIERYECTLEQRFGRISPVKGKTVPLGEAMTKPVGAPPPAEGLGLHPIASGTPFPEEFEQKFGVDDELDQKITNTIETMRRVDNKRRQHRESLRTLDREYERFQNRLRDLRARQ